MSRRICFLFSMFPPISMGGVQRYLLSVSKGLEKHGISSVVLTRHYPPLPRTETFPYCTVRRIGLNPFPYSPKRYVSMATSKIGDLLTYTILGYPEAVRCVMKCAVVHSQFAIMSDVKLGKRIAERTGRRHVITVHVRFGNQAEDFPLTREALCLLREANHVIVNRISSLQLLSKHGIEDISLLRNPVPVKDYRPPEDFVKPDKRNRPIRVLFIGRLVERRGPHLALEGFAHALKTSQNLELWIVGTGELEGSLKSYAKKERIENKIRFFGEQRNVRQFLWKSDIFLAPSRIANSPSLALREAMAAGLAVIATDVEETRQIVIPNRTGLVVSPNPQAIGEAIVELGSDDELMSILGVAASRFAMGNFDVGKYTESLVEIYSKLIREAD